MTEAILHIGTHKTGTTSFQQWLRRSAPSIAASGVTPYSGLLGDSHAEFALLAMNADRGMPIKSMFPDWCLTSWQNDARSAIAAQMNGPDEKVLVSAEALCYLRSNDEMQRLAELCDRREIRVIMVCRDPTTFLTSYRATLDRLGFDPSPYPESFAYVEPDSWLVDYDAVISAYRTIADPSMIHVIDYEKAVAEDGSIIPVVATAAGVDIGDTHVDGDWANTSTGHRGRRRARDIARRWLPPALVPVTSRLVDKARHRPVDPH